MAVWTFFTNHAIALIFPTIHPLVTGRALSRLTGITERTVRNVVSDLELAGYIEKSKEERQLKYKINPDLPFHLQTQRGKATGILLEALGWKPKRKRARR